MQAAPLPLLGGLLSFTPLYGRLFPRRGSGGKSCAHYCYSVWLRHLERLYDCGMGSVPRRIAELGPGESLGHPLSEHLSLLSRPGLEIMIKDRIGRSDGIKGHRLAPRYRGMGDDDLATAGARLIAHRIAAL